MSSLSFDGLHVVVLGPRQFHRSFFRKMRDLAISKHGRKVFRVEIDPDQWLIKVYCTSPFRRGGKCYYHEI